MSRYFSSGSDMVNAICMIPAGDCSYVSAVVRGYLQLLTDTGSILASMSF